MTRWRPQWVSEISCDSIHCKNTSVFHSFRTTVLGPGINRISPKSDQSPDRLPDPLSGPPGQGDSLVIEGRSRRKTFSNALELTRSVSFKACLQPSVKKLLLKKNESSPMVRSLESHQLQEGLAMVIVSESAQPSSHSSRKRASAHWARQMVMRMVLGFICHRGRMSCSQAACTVASEPIHRGQMTPLSGTVHAGKRTTFTHPLRQEILRIELSNREGVEESIRLDR